MRTVYYLLLCSTVIISSACAVKTTKPSVLQTGGISAITNTSDIQITVVKKHGAVERYCAARPSDVADTKSAGVSLTAGLAGNSSEGINEGRSQGAISLGGRDPAVLIVREMMYRACELSMNLNADSKQTLEIYSTFMTAIQDIANTQTGDGIEALGQSADSVLTISDSDSESTSLTTSSDSSTTSDTTE